MRFISTRNEEGNANFERVVLDCMPCDGGLFVPAQFPDLRRWILYTNEKTPFASIAGSLTSACINDEFSPIVCETIASKAFPFNPELKKLDENFYLLDLTKGPTGSHSDFEISYLVNSLETMFALNGGEATFLDVTTGEIGVSLTKAIRGKKHLKAILVYPKGCARGLEEEDFIWNGGNIYPVEFVGDVENCRTLVREIFADSAFVKENHLTVANSANIGRLMPKMFFYPFAFSRLKEKVSSNIYYAMDSENFSGLVAGLYAWKLALPMGGLITPMTTELTLDIEGNCEVVDNIVPLAKRLRSDPVSPSNLERLENVFNNNAAMLQNLVFLADVSESETEDACQLLYTKYKIYANKATSRAFAAAMKRNDLTDDAVTVLVMRDSPLLSKDFIQHAIGEVPEKDAKIESVLRPLVLKEKISTVAELRKVIRNLGGAKIGESGAMNER